MGWGYEIDEETGGYIRDPVTLEYSKQGTFRNRDGDIVDIGSDLQPDIIVAVGTPKGTFLPDPTLGSTVDEILRERPALGIEPLLEQSIEASLQILVAAGRMVVNSVVVALDGNRAVAAVQIDGLAEPFTLILGNTNGIA